METIILKGKVFQYEVIYKHIKKVYFRYRDDHFVVTASKKNTLAYIESQFYLMENEMIRLFEKSSKLKRVDYSDQSTILFLGKEYQIQYADKTKIAGNIIYLSGKDKIKEFEKLIRLIAIDYFMDRIHFFFPKIQTNAPLPKVKFRLMKSRYGVYNKNLHQITFNSSLVQMDKDLIDYIIVHELSHIKVMSHQKEFYQVVASVMPNYRIYEQRLKKEGVIK